MKKIVLFCFIWLLTFFSCTKHETISKNEFVIGTICSIQIPKTPEAEKILDKCFEELRRLEMIFSAHDDKAELALLNKSAPHTFVTVSDELYELIDIAKNFSMLTDYAFEPAIGHLVNLWSIGFDNEKIPESSEIEATLEFCSSEYLRLEGQSVMRMSEYCQVDLGAIAKGYATDHIASILRAENIESAIINLGGNILALGKKFFSNSAWSIGLRDPAGTFDMTKKIVAVENKSVVTSGIYERFFFEDGKRYHHVLDPKTGYPVENEIASVSIIADSSTLADVLATACLILGYEKSMSVLSNFDVVAVFFFKDGSIQATDESIFIGD